MCIDNERRGICDLLIGVSGLARPRYHGIQRGDMLVLELWILPYRNSPRRIRMAGNLGHLSSHPAISISGCCAIISPVSECRVCRNSDLLPIANNCSCKPHLSSNPGAFSPSPSESPRRKNLLIFSNISTSKPWQCIAIVAAHPRSPPTIMMTMGMVRCVTFKASLKTFQ